MNRPNRARPIASELAELEEQLAALTLRVAQLRARSNAENTEALRVPTVGDRVRFYIAGQGYADGVIIGITASRVRIRQERTNHIFLRAPHNVTLL